jgi:putative oxygen-independent coproporphyrinogen III oxidase
MARGPRRLAVGRVLGLYVHIPFCSAICNYCNFNRGLYDANLKRRYLAALLTEIRKKGDRSPADTIYFGGGTPSLLEPSEVQDVIEACRDSFDLARGVEITLEANPETVTHDRLRAFRDAGINRVSFGVQSFRDEELQRLTRLHSAARAQEAFEMARQAGFDNVSLDLMMWLPQQTVAQWFASVDALIALGPEHASLYLLEIYPNAPLRDAMARSQWSLAPDDDAAEMYLGAMSRLDDAGYVQYEISNVSRAGFQSRHNLKYWTDGEWLGFGCGAHSTRRGIREKNIASTEDYIAAVSAGLAVETDRRVLSLPEQLEEALFMGLRLTEGVRLDTVRSRYGVDLWERYGEDLGPFVDQNLLIYDGAVVRLTREGMLLANEVMSIFIGPPVR